MEASEQNSIEEIIETQQPVENETNNFEIEVSSIATESKVLQATGVGERNKTEVSNKTELEVDNQAEDVEFIEHAEYESDETFDKQCQPCLSEDKNVESKKYCINCEEYLCETCIQFHKKFSSTKKHKLLDKTDVHSDDKQKAIKPLETCSQHIGKELDLFCKDHDKLCCLSCKVTDHIECKNVISITDAASGVRDGQEFKTVNEQLKQTHSGLKYLVLKRENDGIRIVTEGDAAIQILTKYAEDIIKQISKLKKFDENKIKTKIEDESELIREDVDNCEEVDSMLSNASEILEKNTYDDIYTFTQMKRAKQNIASAKKVMSVVSNKVGSEKIVYAKNKLVSEKLKNFKGLGLLKQEKRVYKKSTSKVISLLKQSKQKSKSKSKSEIYIQSICLLKNVWILMSDWTYGILRLLDMSTMNVVESIAFAHNPFDLCQVEDCEIAVTFLHAKIVQFVSFKTDTNPHLKKQKSFDAGEKCRGIAYLNSELFIACGGCGTENEGPGHIRVFSLDGTHKKTIINDQTGALLAGRPWKLEVSPVSKDLYLIDLDNGFLKLSTQDGTFSQLIRKNTNNQGGLSFDEHGSIFITDHTRNVIEQIGIDGQLVGTILTENDGIKKPTAIAYDSETRQLYVAMESASVLSVFHLDYD